MPPETSAPLSCPRCRTPMTTQVLEGHLGAPVTIDVCLACQLFWFDPRESLQLSPASTLALFRLIGDGVTRRPPPADQEAAPPSCPRCGVRLRLTRDRQRNTTFQYLRCPRAHGRLTAFYDFLREKDFIRPLSPAQIAELRQHVQTIHCSNCGAPMNLAAGSSCAHCGAALGMLDLTQGDRLVAELQRAGQRRPVDPALPLDLDRARRDVTAAFDAFEREPGWYEQVSTLGVVGAGLGAIARWLRQPR